MTKHNIIHRSRLQESWKIGHFPGNPNQRSLPITPTGPLIQRSDAESLFKTTLGWHYLEYLEKANYPTQVFWWRRRRRHPPTFSWSLKWIRKMTLLKWIALSCWQKYVSTNKYYLRRLFKTPGRMHVSYSRKCWWEKNIRNSRTTDVIVLILRVWWKCLRRKHHGWGPWGRETVTNCTTPAVHSVTMSHSYNTVLHMTLKYPSQ